LSFAQERFWFIDQLQVGNTSYNISRALRIFGGLELGTLECVINEVVRRHEILRTVFPEKEGKPVQAIGEFQWQFVPLVDLADLGEEDRKRTVEELIGAEGVRPFDLQNGPVLRLSLLRLSAE